MKPKTDFVPGDKPFTKSEQTDPDYVPDYDSVKDEHIDEGNQEKIVNELSEKLDTTNSTKFENMETFVANGEIDIKSEYVEDTISDLTWDRIKVEEKLEQGIEADSTADTVDQIKMEFQESVKIEENTDALMLNEEIDIKTESEESDDLAYVNAQIKKHWEREQMEEKNLFSRYVCNCTDRSDTGLSVHIECEKHKASKIHECTFCDFKTIHENNLSDHMFKHTNASNLHI